MHEIFNKLQFCATTDFSLDLSGKVYKTVFFIRALTTVVCEAMSYSC